MEKNRPTFKLYILGYLNDYSQPLTMLAEFYNSRAIERVSLDKDRIEGLSEAIRNLHRFIETSSPRIEERALKDLGEQMCNLILQRKVRSLFDIATGRSPELLPFELFVEDATITSWPWEYLYDSNQKSFLSQEFHPISRGIFTIHSRPPMRPIKDKVRILLIIGVLPQDGKTTPEDEIKWIKEVFGAQLATESVEIRIMQAVRPRDIDDELQRNTYDVLHYFGHARFDEVREQGYLKLERQKSKPFRFYANDLAMRVANKKIRLVFLNGCETGRTSKNEDPARSSIAAALLARGIPAVIATQFSIPDITAHYLSSMIYNSLVTGLPMVEAMRNGRHAMGYSDESRITDWGIPVLYTSDPELIIFPKSKWSAAQKWSDDFSKSLETGDALKALEMSSTPDSPSVTVERTALPENKKMAQVRVALIDFDAKVGFLPDLVEQANKVQHYYNFEVNYLPLPSGAIKTDFIGKDVKVDSPQLYLPSVEDYLITTPEDLNVNKVCCLTGCRIAVMDEEEGLLLDLRYSALNNSEDVAAISVYMLRDYAEQASISYAKAILYICLSYVVASDERLPKMIHDETFGCLFDDCGNRDDLVVGFERMKFDHPKCRRKIKNKEQLAAIDSLLALEISTEITDKNSGRSKTSRSSDRGKSK